jgi:predicted nucleic acid-binding protein
MSFRRQSFIDERRIALTVYPYTEETALLAGRIDGEQTARGTIIPFSDLLVGATALSLGYSILTSNARHFRLIPGLNVILL